MMKYKVTGYMHNEEDKEKGFCWGIYDKAPIIIKMLKNAFKWPPCKRLHVEVVYMKDDKELYTKEADIFLDWTIDIVVRKFFNIK